MENLNAEQVKKALKCCGEYTHGTTCNNCPYMHIELADNEICSNRMSQDALALITSQEQRIKELTEENERMKKALNTGMYIVRSYRGSGNSAHLRELVRVRMDAVRADTVRKMLEKLHARKVSYGNITFRVVPLDDIDHVAKEILEGENG